MPRYNVSEVLQRRLLSERVSVHVRRVSIGARIVGAKKKMSLTLWAYSWGNGALYLP